MGGRRKNHDEGCDRSSGCLESCAKARISHGEGRAGGSVEVYEGLSTSRQGRVFER